MCMLQFDVCHLKSMHEVQILEDDNITGNV